MSEWTSSLFAGTAQISTIGYQQRTGAEMLGVLREAKIEVLVDIRAVPMSRKPDFRKRKIEETANSDGIDYVGISGLGTPRFLRDKLALDKNYDEFFDAFRDHLKTVEAHFAQLASLAATKRVALMCFERNPGECHRSEVAARLSTVIESRVFHL